MSNLTIYWDDTPLEEAHRTLIIHALETAVGNKDNREVSITFASTTEIKKLNNDYRGKNVETDVLSFPGMGNVLGDIVICLAVAQQQALEYGHSYERELVFLAVHGVLHLMGYDHETPADETRMISKQDEIMGIIGVQR